MLIMRKLITTKRHNCHGKNVRRKIVPAVGLVAYDHGSGEGCVAMIGLSFDAILYSGISDQPGRRRAL